MTRYELKLADGSVVTWQGRDGVDAATRYVDAHREAAVVAPRDQRVQLNVGC